MRKILLLALLALPGSLGATPSLTGLLQPDDLSWKGIISTNSANQALLNASTQAVAVNIATETAARIAADYELGASSAAMSISTAAETAARIAGDYAAGASTIALATAVGTSTQAVAVNIATETAARIAADYALGASTAATSVSTAALAQTITTETGDRINGDYAAGASTIALAAAVGTSTQAVAVNIATETAARIAADYAVGAATLALAGSAYQTQHTTSPFVFYATMSVYGGGNRPLSVTATGVGIHRNNDGSSTLQVQSDTTGIELSRTNGDILATVNGNGAQGKISAYYNSATVGTEMNGDSFFVGVTSLVVKNGMVGISTDPADLSALNIFPPTTSGVATIQATGFGNYPNAILNLRGAQGTRAAPTVQAPGGALGSVDFYGKSGLIDATHRDGFSISAQIQANATEDWTTTANGSSITIRTTAQGSTVQSPRMTISHNGNIGIGTISPGSVLHVSGKISVDESINVAGQTTSSITIHSNATSGFNLYSRNDHANGWGTKIQAGSAVGDYPLYINKYDDSANIFNVQGDGRVYAAGSVGIGTTNPGNPLEVAGANPIKASTWTATYAGGSAFVCISDAGTLFVSELVCP